MWTKNIEKDLRAGKAHRHIASILKLMEYCENTQPDKPDYSTMSDEELLEIISPVSAGLVHNDDLAKHYWMELTLIEDLVRSILQNNAHQLSDYYQ